MIDYKKLFVAICKYNQGNDVNIRELFYELQSLKITLAHDFESVFDALAESNPRLNFSTEEIQEIQDLYKDVEWSDELERIYGETSERKQLEAAIGQDLDKIFNGGFGMC